MMMMVMVTYYRRLVPEEPGRIIVRLDNYDSDNEPCTTSQTELQSSKVKKQLR
jgi:hypothetical protein